MGLIAQVTVSLNVPLSPGGPGMGLPRTGIAVAWTVLLACALVAAGVVTLMTTRTNRRQGDAG